MFVDGVHYPATEVDENGNEDENGNKPVGPDLSRPLRWDVETSGYRDADDDETLHNDTHHQAEVEVAPGGED